MPATTAVTSGSTRGPAGSAASRSTRRTLRRFVGGVGLGTWIVAHETPAGVDPLGPDAALVFALSPLVGSPLTTSAKFAVVAISPLTGRLCDALSSSHFAIAAKRTGVDAIAISGACDEPSVVFIDGTGRDEPRGHVPARRRPLGPPRARGRGPDPGRARARLAGRGDRPGGRAADPVRDDQPRRPARRPGRPGGGARVEADQGRRRPGRPPAPLADPRRRSRSPATSRPARSARRPRSIASWARSPTCSSSTASTPCRPATSSRATSKGPSGWPATTSAPRRRVARTSCAACTIGCEHIYAVGRRRGGASGSNTSRCSPSGRSAGSTTPTMVLRAASACDDVGLDTISTGGTIAFVMDCAERGWVDGRVGRSGRRLRFGDGEAVLDAIGAIVDRDGPRRTGSRWGAAGRPSGSAAGRSAWPRTSRGWSCPATTPRALHTMALGLAVGTRGADHNRSGAYEADFSDRADRRRGGAASALAGDRDRGPRGLDGLADPLQVPPRRLHRLLRRVGRDAPRRDRLGRRRRRAARTSPGGSSTPASASTSARAGPAPRTPCPARFLVEDRPGRPALSRDRLDAMIAAYYRRRGWDETGRVPGSSAGRWGSTGRRSAAATPPVRRVGTGFASACTLEVD